MLDFLAYIFFSVLLPLVGVSFLGWAAFRLWVHYIQQDFISGIEWVLLEIVPPREVLRSPKAMELFLTNALYHWSNKGGVEEYWQGAVWFWHSLEIASLEGQGDFYIRTGSRLKRLVETQMYAQYPQAQVKLAEDYTLAVDRITDESAWNLWGCEFKLTKPEAYPIRTYVDYGLDKDPKEEYKVDPVSSVIELFSSIGPGEQMWSQVVIKPPKKKYHTSGTWFGHHDWVKESEITLEKLLKPYTNIKKQANNPNEFAMETRTPDKFKPIVDGMTKKVLKLGFETGVRICYVAKKENFNMSNRRNMRLLWRQYESPTLNGFYRINSTQADAYGTNFIASWLLLSKAKIMRLSDRMLEEYRERAFFYLPLRHAIHFPWPISPYIFPNYFHHKTFMLNVEELATLWHFPGQILKVPTLERIESKEAAPPPNLPT